MIRKQLWLSVYSLFELLIHGQDGRVAHEGEGQDGNGVDSLENTTDIP